VTGEPLAGKFVVWTDTVGVKNNKWSYFLPFWNKTQAHVEAVEDGNHQVAIEDQPSCKIGDVFWGDGYDKRVGGYLGFGPTAFTVAIKNAHRETAVYFTIYCIAQ
jgi:hypothetical protein